jgi:hypothetical protein
MDGIDQLEDGFIVVLVLVLCACIGLIGFGTYLWCCASPQGQGHNYEHILQSPSNSDKCQQECELFDLPELILNNDDENALLELQEQQHEETS